MRILSRTDDSVLWLYVTNTHAINRLRTATREHGISEKRVAFAHPVKFREHLARHQLADLFLDTFHYGAHVTASDALWAGLPVLTKLGDTFASRVGASLVTAAGLSELVARDTADYERRAIELARKPAMLIDIKRRLEKHRQSCPLFDTPRYTRNLEAIYQKMWDLYRAGQPAEHIEIADDA
jgi:predicted O-linked N-acetylglucosamine transferase (SPINDLY family)